MEPILRPMLAVQGKPFNSPNYLFEIKWDGYRALVYIKESVELYSRNGKRLNKYFPEIINSFKILCSNKLLVFDGELVLLDELGKANFSLLQQKMKTKSENNLATFMLFDILIWNNKDICHLKLSERKEIITDLFNDKLFDQRMVLSKTFPEKGEHLYRLVKEQNVEGIIGKEIDSPYLPGKRSNHWMKIKVFKEGDFVIGGYIPAKRGFKSLCVGQYYNARLIHLGNVGNGFTDNEIYVFLQALLSIKKNECPFHNLPSNSQAAVWVAPILVVSIEYLQLTSNYHLRHPVFSRLRTDKEATECILEDPV